VCSLPATCKDWRSHHSIRLRGKPILHANFVFVCSIERTLLPMKVLHWENRNFRPFWLCDLDPMPIRT